MAILRTTQIPILEAPGDRGGFNWMHPITSHPPYHRANRSQDSTNPLWSHQGAARTSILEALGYQGKDLAEG